MKVGIMSMQRIKNLGSFLQAYGLKEIITELGHQVVFIDIPDGDKIQFEKIADKKDKNVIYDKTNKLMYIKNIKYYKKRHLEFYENEFENYLQKYLCLPKENVYEECDVLVVGSDEVFNCLNYDKGFTTATFGGYDKTKKSISYAASCGWTKYEILNDNQKCEISKSMRKLDGISVRDENTKKFSEKFTDKEILMHLDPVLVANFNNFFNSTNERIVNGEYILIYGYYNRISERDYIKKIKKLAKKEKCKIIALGSPQYWCDDYVTVNPKDILKVFKQAKYVITDTFHGAILSVKSQSQFVTIIRRSNYNKLSYLLESLKLGDRVISNGNDIEKKLHSEIIYDYTNEFIKKERDRTVAYLKKNII